MIKRTGSLGFEEVTSSANLAIEAAVFGKFFLGW